MDIDQEQTFKYYYQDVIGKEPVMIALAKPGSECEFNRFQFLIEPTLDKVLNYTKRKEHIAFLSSIDLDKVAVYHSPKEPQSIIEGKTYYKGVSKSCLHRVICMIFDLDLKKLYPEIVSLPKIQREAMIHDFFKKHIEPMLGRYNPVKYVTLTGGGLHLVVVFESPVMLTADEYSKTYSMMAAMLEGDNYFNLAPGTFDRSCSNINKVMRLALSDNSKYSIKEPTKVIFLADCIADAPSGNLFIDLGDTELKQDQKANPTKKTPNSKLILKASNYVAPIGCRNDRLVKMLRDMFGSGMSEEKVYKEVLEYQKLVDSKEDRFTIEEADSIYKRQLQYHRENPFTPPRHIGKEKFNYPDIAENFVLDFFKDSSKLVSHQGRLYQYEGNYYKEVPETHAKGAILRFLQGQEFYRPYATTRTVAEVLSNINAKYQCNNDQSSPFWLKNQREGFFIPLVDKILHVKKDGKNILIEDILHTPDFFCTYCLNVQTGSKKKAKIFFKILKQILPNKEEQQILQEFIGLCLLQDSSFEAMLFLFGKGANGKSVISTIIRVLIGDENVSQVPIEAFFPQSFALASMIGKSVNMPTEFGRLPKEAESILKVICSGEMLQINRKFKDPINVAIKAKMIFLTNSLPVFKDTSNGLSRRTIILHFKQQFHGSDRDPKLKDPSFWKETGELPAIFEWALEGLVCLIKRGEFKIPDHMQTFMKNHFTQLDPAIEFINDTFVEDAQGVLSPAEAYYHYKTFCVPRGVAPINQTVLTRQILAHFPKAIQDGDATPNKRMLNNPDFPKKDRKIRGVRFPAEIELLTSTHITQESYIKAAEKGGLKILPGFGPEELN